MSVRNFRRMGSAFKTIVCLAALVAGTAFVTRQVMSDEQPKAGGQPAMSAEEKAMMEAMAPGPFHRHLDAFVGEWNTDCNFWMEPGQPAQNSKGTASTKWILDGRHLQTTCTGTMMNMPFNGIATTSYDNTKKKYINTWIDSMGTGVFIDEGTVDAAGKVFTSEGDNMCCMTGKEVKTKTVHRIVNESKHVFEMHGPDPKTGKVFKSMEITYTRK